MVTDIPRNIPLYKLSPGEYQPRQIFDKDLLQNLADTIKKVGILAPLFVRPIGSNNTFEIIAGERRWQAAQLAGLEEVPCIIRSCTNEEAAQIALIENISRQNLNPIEEAIGINRLISEFDYTHEIAASTLGKPRTEISNLLRLLKLDDRVQTLISTGKLSEAHGKILAGISKNEQYPYAYEVVKRNLSVRALEREIKSKKKPISNNSNVEIEKLERNLSDFFATSVKFNLKSQREGNLLIHFSSLDELEGILDKVGFNKAEVF